MMGCHPDIQEKVIQEIDEIFGESDRPATFQDTLEMKYLERCLMETLRMYPPVPIIAREIKTDLKLGKSSDNFEPINLKHFSADFQPFNFSFGWLHSPSRLHSRHCHFQTSPSTTHLSQPGCLQPRQFLAREDSQPSLLRFRTLLCWTTILRRT